MSKIGKINISIPEKVKVVLNGNIINIDGPLGKKSLNKSCRKSRLWGMRVRSGISQKGRSILQAGKEVGIVTSSTWSPYQECGVAIVRMDFSINVKSGLELEAIGLDGNLYYAQICELPMYDPKGEIVRGINRKTPTEPSPWLG